MANYELTKTKNPKRLEKLEAATTFRALPLIEKYSQEDLADVGFYRGGSCPHGHVIRDTTNHWCYFCVKKIISNACGFDVSYLHRNYKQKYVALWKRIDIKHPEDCWDLISHNKTVPKRVCMPSYRSRYSANLSEPVTMSKAIYQCAWGDVGSLQVTRTCNNPICHNPLHMISSFNRVTPPTVISPFETAFQVEKLMLFARQENKKEGIAPVVESKFKPSITHPSHVGPAPEYDEG